MLEAPQPVGGSASETSTSVGFGACCSEVGLARRRATLAPDFKLRSHATVCEIGGSIGGSTGHLGSDRGRAGTGGHDFGVVGCTSVQP